MKIGLPRALTYYEYGGLAQTFLEMLDQEVVISPPTQEEIMRLGTSLCVDEACLPVKLFHGHAAWLKDRVDAIFLPVLKGVARHEDTRPKMIGLTDMVRHSIPGLPRIDFTPRLRSRAVSIPCVEPSGNWAGNSLPTGPGWRRRWAWPSRNT